MTQPTPIVLFQWVRPDDSSCANLRNAHVNLSNLWLMAAILYCEAGMYDRYTTCMVQAKAHAFASNMMNDIATLAYFMRHMNPQ